MKILFHRHTEWQGSIRCSTNIFADLAIKAGHDVTYMHGMVHVGNVLAKNGRYRFWKKGLRREAGANVFTPLSMVPYSRIPPFDGKFAAQASYKTCLPSIKTQLDRIDFVPDVIWSANPGSIALRDYYPDAKFLFQVVDFYPAFSGSKIHDVEQADYRGADHIFVIGETLKQYLESAHNIAADKISVLGQGVNLEAYAQPLVRPKDIPANDKYAVWVGVMSKIDVPMLEKAAEALQQAGYKLVLIGPEAGWESEFVAKHGNTLFLGARSPQEVPAYLSHADLALMLYDQRKKDVYQGQNPLKLYEYAAAGLPILSTPHDEYAYLHPPAVVIKSLHEVGSAVSEIIDDRQKYAASAKAFVQDRSWLSIYERAQHYFS